MKSWVRRGKSLRFAVEFCCLCAFVLLGYTQAIFGGILQNEDFLNQFNHPSDSMTGIIASCLNLGCLAGCITSFFIGEGLGRRYTLWFGTVFVIIGAALQTSAFAVAHLIAARIVTGYGVGIQSSTIPVYQAELAAREKRGRLASANILFITIGIVLAYWLYFFISYTEGAVVWRLPIALQIVFAILIIIVVFCIPESPRWMANQGRRNEAAEILCAINDITTDNPFNEPLIVAEIDAIDQAIILENKSSCSGSSMAIFKKDLVCTRFRVLLAFGVQFINQAGGVNLVLYYIPTVLIESVGLEPRPAQVLAGCINTMFMVGAILPTFALDRMGRRPTMMLGCAGCGICMMFVSVLMSQAQKHDVGHDFASAAMTFLFLFMLIFGMSISCASWAYVPEILPLEARTKGTSVGIGANWLLNFIVVMISPVVMHRLQWKAYLIFMTTNLLFVPLVYFFYPETSKLSLEDIDIIFTSGANPVAVAKEMQKQLKTRADSSVEPSMFQGSVDWDTETLSGQSIEKV